MKDYLSDDNDDLQIADGDWVVDDCDEQDIVLVMRSDKGNWKQWPLCGYGVTKDLNAPLTPSIVRARKKELQAQLEANAFEVDEIDYVINNNGDLEDIQVHASR